MKKIFFIFIALNLISYSQTKDESKILKAKWQKDQIAKGVELNYFHFDTLYGSLQSISYLKVSGREISIAFKDTTRILTSSFGKENNAIAALNGSFFDMKKGGSVLFLKVEGIVIDTNKDEKGFIGHCAFAFNDYQDMVIITKDTSKSWGIVPKYKNIVASGPLLLLNSDTIVPKNVKFNIVRHPRTAVGITKDKSLILVAVDGRANEASGMTIRELRGLMKSLACVDALNFDGGGSTTLWINGKGVVNYPSDNKKFDHEGERKVANALIVK